MALAGPRGPPPLRLACLGRPRKHQIENGQATLPRWVRSSVGSRNPVPSPDARQQKRRALGAGARCLTRRRPEGSSPDQWLHETGRASRASSSSSSPTAKQKPLPRVGFTGPQARRRRPSPLLVNARLVYMKQLLFLSSLSSEEVVLLGCSAFPSPSPSVSGPKRLSASQSTLQRHSTIISAHCHWWFSKVSTTAGGRG